MSFSQSWKDSKSSWKNNNSKPKSIESIDAGKVFEICDFVDVVGIVVDEYAKIAKKYGVTEYDFKKDDVSFDDWKKLQIIDVKMEELESRGDYFRKIYNDDYEAFDKDLKSCPNFHEVDMKMDYYGLD